ncbi:MAG: hypothetical protein Q9200_007260, partial [Gallowayella weberi]
MAPTFSSSPASSSPPVSSRTRASPSKIVSESQHEGPLRPSGNFNGPEQHEEWLKQLTPATIYRLRQAIRAQYQWSLPLDAGCVQHLPNQPLGLGKVLNVTNVDQHRTALQSRCLKYIGTLKVVFTAHRHRYALDDAQGRPLPYRGQGPIWDQNSCHLDACIVAARLLNLGSTAADRVGHSRETWLASLKPVQKKFLELISADWESMDGPTNIQLRHSFWDGDLARLPGIKPPPEFGSAALVWETCTSQMKQFRFQETQGHGSCRHCGAASTPKTLHHQQSLSLDLSQAQFEQHKARYKEWSAKPIGWWISQQLKPRERRCRSCSSNDGRSWQREITGDLPKRLVVVPGPYVQGLISRATSDDVRFSYYSNEGEQKAAYRWLGGIYYEKAHFRIYWIDGGNGASGQQVRVYDGRNAFGAIIGNVPVSNPDEKVPRPWSQAPTVLFYERISDAALHVAAYSVKARIVSGLASALLLEAVGAQRAGPVDEGSYRSLGDQEEDNKEQRATEQHGNPRGLYEDKPGVEELGPGSDTGKAVDTFAQHGKTSQVNKDPPSPEREDGTQKQEEEDGEEEDEEEDEEGDEEERKEEGKDSSEDHSDTQDADGGNEHQKKEDGEDDDERRNDDDKEGANNDNAPEDAADEESRQGTRSPPKSPTRIPPRSPSKAPQTPPPTTKITSLLTSFSPAAFLGLFTPARSQASAKPQNSPAHQAPLPPSYEEDETIDRLNETPGSNPSYHPLSSASEDEDISPPNTSENEPPLLLTPPFTPPRKRRIVTSTSIIRRSPRSYKPRTSTRIAQMIPPNTRTAGSMGPYKPLPGARMYDAGGRGRSMSRMTSTTGGQKRSSSASSASSTGSSAGGSRGRGGGAVKRLRFAAIN